MLTCRDPLAVRSVPGAVCASDAAVEPLPIMIVACTVPVFAYELWMLLFVAQ